MAARDRRPDIRIRLHRPHLWATGGLVCRQRQPGCNLYQQAAPSFVVKGVLFPYPIASCLLQQCCSLHSAGNVCDYEIIDHRDALSFMDIN
jgi:hypothetical protein